MFCSKCGKENASSAGFCEGCGAELGAAAGATAAGSEPARKVGIVLGLGIVFIPFIFAWFTLRKGHTKLSRILALGWCGLVVISMAAGDNKSSTSTPRQTAATAPPPAQQAASVAKPPQKPQAPPEKLYTLNEPFKLGDFLYNVKKVTARRSVGNQFMREKASEGAIFLIVEYTIENQGKETATVMTNDFKIVDSQQRTFQPASNANTALAMSGKSKDMLLAQVQPGLKKTMMTAFEVPEPAVKAGVTLVIPEKGLFGAGKASIALKM